MFDTGHGRHRDVDGWGRCRRVAAAGVAFTDAFERVEIRVCRHAPGEDRVRPNCREDQREERPTLCMEQNRKGKATLEGVLRFKDAPPDLSASSLRGVMGYSSTYGSCGEISAAHHGHWAVSVRA